MAGGEVVGLESSRGGQQVTLLLSCLPLEDSQLSLSNSTRARLRLRASEREQHEAWDAIEKGQLMKPAS